jgi:predicted RNase H-like nuclease (RuvC/YqgF family)
LSIIFTKYETKSNNAQLQAQVLPQAQVLGELVLEPLNKALQEENSNLKAENRVLKEREVCKQELMDEYKARFKSVEEENQRGKEENQRLRDEAQRCRDESQRYRDDLSSMKEKEAAMRVEIEYLKRRDEESRLERNADRADRNADRAMLQTMISNLMNGAEDRKRKRNDEEETK